MLVLVSALKEEHLKTKGFKKDGSTKERVNDETLKMNTVKGGRA